MQAAAGTIVSVLPARASTEASLGQTAAAHGLLYGAAVGSDKLDSDQRYASLVGRQARLLVAEGETKRKAMQPTPTRFDFHGTDRILAFAQANGQQMRGHTLAWYQGNPDWLTAALSEANPSERLLTDYVQAVVGRYRGRFTSWDVVNEPVSPDQGDPNGMRRDNIWFKAFGERHIDLAFNAAHDADPSVPLFLNELNCEADVRWSAKIRSAALNLVDRLIARKVPISGFGVQGHLKAFRVSYSDRVISDFLDELGARGLKVLITEFDIADIEGPDDQTRRDAEIASLAKRFLDVAFSKPFVQGCLTWGISDRYSWLSQYPQYKWPDGRLSRGLPFDDQYLPTPMFAAMQSAFQR